MNMKRKKTHFCLCDDLLFTIIEFINLYDIFQSIRMIDKQFFRLCLRDSIWGDIIVSGFENKEFNSFLLNYRFKINKLTISKQRFGRKNAINITYLKNLISLNLKNVTASTSLIDDRFCWILKTTKIKELFLPKNNIRWCGIKALSQMKYLETLELRNNESTLPGSYAYSNAICHDFKHGFKQLNNITFFDVFFVDGHLLSIILKKQIKSMAISFCPYITSESVDTISKIENPNLEYCVFHGVSIEAKTIRQFSKTCPNITTFSIGGYKIGKDHYKVLPLLKKLHTLAIICCKDIGSIDFIKKMNLKTLILCRTKLTKDFQYYLKILNEKKCTVKQITDTNTVF